MVSLDPVVVAGVCSFGFVYLHPFEDGNGRIHRFLISDTLAKSGFAPKGVIFPVSATILNDLLEYDNPLESFSASILPMIDYSPSEDGKLVVKNDTALLYRYMDLTRAVEYLYRCVDITFETTFVTEIEFLLNYDLTKKAIQQIVDMPDSLIDNFIMICLQNNGALSKRKRETLFSMLSDDEIRYMEQAVKKNFFRNQGTHL